MWANMTIERIRIFRSLESLFFFSNFCSPPFYEMMFVNIKQVAKIEDSDLGKDSKIKLNCQKPNTRHPDKSFYRTVTISCYCLGCYSYACYACLIINKNLSVRRSVTSIRKIHGLTYSVINNTHTLFLFTLDQYTSFEISASS